MEIEGDYLLFVDGDMQFGPDDCVRLQLLDKDIAGGLFVSTHFPFVPNIGMIESQKPWIAKTFAELNRIVPNEPFQLDCIGCGFTMVKRKVFEALKPPWFYFGPDWDKGDAMGEDWEFCRRAKLAGFEVWCHPHVRPGHIDYYPYTYDDHIRAMEVADEPYGEETASV